MNNKQTMTVFVTPDHDTDLVWPDFTRFDHLSIAEACLASDAADRAAARAARADGAEFTDWMISDRV